MAIRSSQMPDQQALSTFLADCLGRKVAVTDLRRMEGGWSRQLHRAVLDDGTVLALRGEVPHGVIDADLAREYTILAALTGSEVPLPPLVGFESTGDVLGHRFIAMDWVEGLCPNLWRRTAAGTLGLAADSSLVGELWTRDISALHDLDVHKMYAAGIDGGLDARTYVETEVSGWTSRLHAVSDHPGMLVEEACQWLAGNIPTRPVPPAVVHGDLRLGNMLVQSGRVVAFLDWEMAGVGDWRADIGYSLMPYNAGKLLAPIPPSWNQLLQPRQFLDGYAETSGRSLSDAELVFFVVLGCVKMIGILCTGIEAYRSGRSSDPRLAWTSLAIPGLVEDICTLLDHGLPW